MSTETSTDNFSQLSAFVPSEETRDLFENFSNLEKRKLILETAYELVKKDVTTLVVNQFLGCSSWYNDGYNIKRLSESSYINTCFLGSLVVSILLLSKKPLMYKPFLTKEFLVNKSQGSPYLFTEYEVRLWEALFESTGEFINPTVCTDLKKLYSFIMDNILAEVEFTSELVDEFNSSCF
jgi:hypothetical protein